MEDLHLFLEDPTQGLWAPTPLDHDAHEPEVTLGGGDIVARGVILDPPHESLHVEVRDHSHDGPPRTVSIGGARPELAPQGIRSGEDALGEALVDDGHRVGVGTVLSREIPPGEDLHAEGPKQSGGHPTVTDSGVIPVLSVCRPLDAYRGPRGREARENSKDMLAGVYHFLGEVEVVFGLWVIPLIITIALFHDWGTVVNYVNHGVNLTEAAFVVVIMIYLPCLAASVVFTKEAGGIKYFFYLFALTTVVAYVLAFLAYRMTLLII